MQFYSLIFTFHIIFASFWLMNFVAEPLFKKAIANSKGKSGEGSLISIYLKFNNLSGMVGAIGILITGIWLVSLNPGYGFFDFSANHWLATKQIVMVVILILLGWKLIPTAKKLRLAISDDLKSPVEDKSQVHENLKKLYSLNLQVNILVIINFLMAITRVFYS